MLGVALTTGMLAAFSQVNGDLVITSSCCFSPLVGRLAVSPQDLGGLVTRVLEGVREVSTSNTSCCLRRAVSG